MNKQNLSNVVTLIMFLFISFLLYVHLNLYIYKEDSKKCKLIFFEKRIE